MNPILNNPIALGAILSLVNPFVLTLLKPALEKLPFVNPNLPDSTLHDISVEISNIVLQAATVLGAHLAAQNLNASMVLPLIVQIASQAGIARFVYSTYKTVLSQKSNNDLQNLINQVNKIAPEIGAALAAATAPAPAAAPASTNAVLASNVSMPVPGAGHPLAKGFPNLAGVQPVSTVLSE